MSGAAEALPPELADLELVAMAADAQLVAGALPPGAEAPPPVDRGAEFGAMLTMAVTMATPALPFLPQCYTAETCAQIGTALAAVAEKHGWNLDALSSPELVLAAVALPPTITAIVLGRAHFAARAAAAIDKAKRSSTTAPQHLQPVTQDDNRPHAGQRVL